jgi:hypothetical protein
MPRKKTNLDIKKDNPVPSIDDLTLSNLIEFFENFMDATSNDLGNSSTEDITITRTKHGLMLSNEWSKDKIILQNGVEANNEQPKLDKDAFLAHSCSSIKGCCYGQSGDCDGTEKSFKEDLKRYEEWVGKMRNYFIKDDGDTTEGYCPPGCTCSL